MSVKTTGKLIGAVGTFLICCLLVGWLVASIIDNLAIALVVSGSIGAALGKFVLGRIIQEFEHKDETLNG